MRQPDSSNPDLSPTSLALVRDAEARLREVGAFDEGFGRRTRFRGRAPRTVVAVGAVALLVPVSSFAAFGGPSAMLERLVASVSRSGGDALAAAAKGVDAGSADAHEVLPDALRSPARTQGDLGGPYGPRAGEAAPSEHGRSAPTPVEDDQDVVASEAGSSSTEPDGGGVRDDAEPGEAGPAWPSGHGDGRGDDRPRGNGKPDRETEPGEKQKPEKGKPEDSGKPNDAGKPAAPGKPGDTGRPEDVGKPDDAGRPEDKRPPDEAGKPDDAGKPAAPGKPDDAGKPDDTGQPDDENRPEAAEPERGKPDDSHEPAEPGKPDGEDPPRDDDGPPGDDPRPGDDRESDAPGDSEARPEDPGGKNDGAEPHPGGRPGGGPKKP
jgi:hypothetical protein